jgi:hypothetical protein
LALRATDGVRSAAVRIAMLDTMVFDLLVADDPARDAVLGAVASDRLRLRTTHVQEDQLAGIKDESKRESVNAIPREVVPTAVAVWDVSRWDAARWGSTEDYDAIRHGESHIADAIIAATASTMRMFSSPRTSGCGTAPVSGCGFRCGTFRSSSNGPRVTSRATTPRCRTRAGCCGSSEFLDLEQRVEAHGEALKEMLGALRAIAAEIKKQNARGLRPSEPSRTLRVCAARFTSAETCTPSVPRRAERFGPNNTKAPQTRGFHLIGETGFEPATARPPAGCATRLRHSPWTL